MESRYESKQISLDEAEKRTEEVRKANRFLILNAWKKVKLNFNSKIY